MKIISVKGECLRLMSTKELAEHILGTPERIHTFTYDPLNENLNSCSWYNIVNIKIFDEQTVFIDKCALDSEPIFNFKLPTYNEKIKSDLGEDQDENCFNDMIKGLNKFNNKSKIWYVKDRIQPIKIIFQ